MNNKSFSLEKLNTFERLAVIGVGSVLKSDDAAGVLAAEKLQKKFGDKNEKIRVFIGSTAPENFTGEIKRYRPDRIIIIDAADLKKEPGSIMIINPDEINGVSFGTHTMPIKMLVDYLTGETGCLINIIGIQPECLTYLEKMTPKVKKAVKKIVDTIGKNCLPSYGL
jgi:hydrogenase 3 maturation protease